MAKKLRIVLLTLCILVAFSGCFNYRRLKINSGSMEPTLKNGDEALVNYDYYKSNKLKKGDMVLIKLDKPLTKTEDMIVVKRIIGLSGDKVEIKNGKVYINDSELKEDYLTDNAVTEPIKESKWTIPEGKVFVLGDNREPLVSLDSRLLGPISEDIIQGYVILKKK